jgi:NAD(P)-dependent dehydrogenase (short-subunit alcohol dehydrogenase family)
MHPDPAWTAKLEIMQRALVTGGASGIGAACATVLEREGWDVVRTDRHASESVRQLDVTDEDAWNELFADTGPFDAMVTCAGIRTRSLIVDTDLDEWERHLKVNLTGTWLALRGFLRAIAPGDTRQRSVVTIASVNATIAVPGQAHYVASKGAVASLTRAAALEGAPMGVRVNSIAPGPIDTPMAAERLNDPEQVTWLTTRVPLGRIGTPSEIGEVAEFLLSDRASYITGEIIYADGGWAANAV